MSSQVPYLMSIKECCFIKDAHSKADYCLLMPEAAINWGRNGDIEG